MSLVCRAGFWAIVLSLAAVGRAAAQDDGGDFTFAYQSQRVTCSGCSATNFPGGFDADLAAKITGMWSVVGQVDWSRKSFSTGNEVFTSYAGGVRWNTLASAVTPFVQALVGVTRDSINLPGNNTKTSNFMVDVDGGVAIPITSGKTTSVVAAVGYRRVAEANILQIRRVLVGIRYNMS